MKDVNKLYGTVPTIAVNCAGITEDNFVVGMQDEQWDRVLNVNLKACVVQTMASLYTIHGHNVIR